VPALLDTSVLIHGTEDPGDDVAISVISLTELHFGVLLAPDDEVRAARLRRLGTIEESFDPLPFEAAAARDRGRLYAAVAQRGGQPRRRAFDLAIAATANVHGVRLLTLNPDDFTLIDDLVDVRVPSFRRPGNGVARGINAQASSATRRQRCPFRPFDGPFSRAASSKLPVEREVGPAPSSFQAEGRGFDSRRAHR